MTAGWGETEVSMDVSSRRLARVLHRHLAEHGLLSFLSLLGTFRLHVIKRKHGPDDGPRTHSRGDARLQSLVQVGTRTVGFGYPISAPGRPPPSAPPCPRRLGPRWLGVRSMPAGRAGMQYRRAQDCFSLVEVKKKRTPKAKINN